MGNNKHRPEMYFKTSDLAIVRWLVEYVHLQPRHFERLSRRHIVSIRRRLRQLLSQGYVERLTLPLPRNYVVNAPPDQFVYRLGRKGVALAQECVDSDLTYNHEKQVTFLQHDLAISELHLAVKLAARETGRLKLAWQQRQLQDWVVDASGERLSVNPDALFSLTDTSLPVENNTRHFFLEMVRAREHSYERGESAIVRKLRGYEVYARQGRHQETWGIPNFRVLTVTPTAQRAANLCAKLVAAELNVKRFFFTDLTCYSLETPASVLRPIWRTPSGEERHSLVK